MYCLYCKRKVSEWANQLGMCSDCDKKCSSCGGTGLVPFHPRLGLSTYCGCEHGKAKAKSTASTEAKDGTR